jgi:hypothetical protein
MFLDPTRTTSLHVKLDTFHQDRAGVSRMRHTCHLVRFFQSLLHIPCGNQTPMHRHAVV